MKKSFILAFVFFLLLSFIIAAFISSRTVNQEKSVPKITDFTSIVPGQTSIDDLTRALGTPVKQEVEDTTTVLYYPTKEDKELSNLVLVNNNNIYLTKEMIYSNAERGFSVSVKLFSEPPIILKKKHIPGESYFPEYIYVFPSVGSALWGDVEANMLFQIWHFAPNLPLNSLLALPDFADFGLSDDVPSLKN